MHLQHFVENDAKDLIEKSTYISQWFEINMGPVL